MILPAEKFWKAVKLGQKWLEDPKTEVLYAHENGAVIRRDGVTLSVRKDPPMAEIKFDAPA
jgi:hypothetical protein